MQIVHLQVTGSKGRSPPAFARPATGLYTNVCKAGHRLTRMYIMYTYSHYNMCCMAGNRPARM